MYKLCLFLRVFFVETELAIDIIFVTVEPTHVYMLRLTSTANIRKNYAKEHCANRLHTNAFRQVV
jgi:hypothetical protein